MPSDGLDPARLLRSKMWLELLDVIYANYNPFLRSNDPKAQLLRRHIDALTSNIKETMQPGIGMIIRPPESDPSRGRAASIDKESKEFFVRCLIRPVSIRHGTYPFKGISLNREDVEWLIQHVGTPLDLRGANLRKARLDRLDLRGTILGLDQDTWFHTALRELSKMATSTSLNEFDATFDLTQLYHAAAADLSDSYLNGVRLDGVTARYVRLDRAEGFSASLRDADLAHASFAKANFTGADFVNCYAQSCTFDEASLQGTILNGADLTSSSFQKASLSTALLRGACLQSCNFVGANLDGVEMTARTRLDGVRLWGADGAAQLVDIIWNEADVSHINWAGVKALGDELDAIRLREHNTDTFRKDKQQLRSLTKQWRSAKPLQRLRKFKKQLAEDKLDEAGVAEARSFLEKYEKLSDDIANAEAVAERSYFGLGMVPPAVERAIRSNRQVGLVLRNQGINEQAVKFQYRAERLKRLLLKAELRGPVYGFSHSIKGPKWWRSVVDTIEKVPGWISRYVIFAIRYSVSWLFDATCGYGYKPLNAVGCYVIVIAGFGLGFSSLSGVAFWPNALAFSVTSFHGRGFETLINGSNGSIPHGAVFLAAFEAVIGLLLEVTFIASFTRRVFDRS
jgi:uncharacterized protein YjbI with pentapeptide repeats